MAATVAQLQRGPPPAPPRDGQSTDADDPLLREFNRLEVKARTDRDRQLPDIQDVYRFALPWRHLANTNQPRRGALNTVFDESAMSILEDFAADMLDTFTPRKNDWIEFEPGTALEKSEAQAAKQDVDNLQNFLFGEMAKSNLYQGLQEAYCDLGVGTMTIIITDIDSTKPLHCEAVVATDIFLLKGPYGRVSGWFRPKKYCRSEIEVLWPDADLSMLEAVPPDEAQKDMQEYDVVDACWRDWSDKGDETYKYAVRVDGGKIIYKKIYKGVGSCPFITARWSRDSTTAWGFGPTYRTLPAIRTLNYTRRLDLKNYDKYVDPPTSYEDDGVINVDQGVMPGTWIPRAVGSEEPKVIESQARFDVATFERDELRSTIRRAHYQDRPEQLGKTPPTATQWSDERAERARRMGTPATNLVEELQYPIIRRFMYLLGERGVLPKVQVDGREIAMEPVSPLLRAQEQEEVIRLDRYAEMIAARFGPQMAIVVINVVKYASKLAELMGVEPKLIRTEAEITNAIQQLMPVLQNLSGGGGGAAATIAPPPVGAITG